MFGVPVSRPVMDLHPLPSHYLAWLKHTFPDQQFDEQFVEQADCVLENIKSYDEFNSTYEQAIDWQIKGTKYVRGY